MMKSFFKKLAFVMALAMVVSMVAPAGSALAATSGVAHQTSKEVVTTYEFEKAGDTVDFCFLGAPKDWKTTFAWTSSDEAVATVDKAGVVTAVAAGTATITITAGADASYKETVVVTVPAAVDFEIAQVDTVTATLTFNAGADLSAVTVDDFAVTAIDEMFEYTLFANTVAVKDNVVTLTFVEGVLTDGAVIKIGYQGVEKELVASNGEVAKVVVSYGMNTNYAGDAYVYTDLDPNYVLLNYKLYDANGIDVTANFEENVDYTIEWALTNGGDYASEPEEGDNGWQMSFDAKGAATVQATVTFTDDEGEERPVPSAATPIVAKDRPAIAFTFDRAGVNNIVGYKDNTVNTINSFNNPWGTIWTDPAYSWVMNTSTVEKGQNAWFAARLTDNRGNALVSTQLSLNLADGWDGLKADGDTEYKDYGYFVYESSNEDILAIDDEGFVTGVEVGSATILVSFVKYTEDGEEMDPVKVCSKRITVTTDHPDPYVKTFAFYNDSLTVTSTGSSVSATAYVKLYDQYGRLFYFGNEYVPSTMTADEINAAAVVTVPSTYEAAANLFEFDAPVKDNDATGGEWAYPVTFSGADLNDLIDIKDNGYSTFKFTLEFDKDFEEFSKVVTKNDKLGVKVYNVDDYYADLTAFYASTASAVTTDFAKWNWNVYGGAKVDTYADMRTEFDSCNWKGSTTSKNIGVKINSAAGLKLMDLPASHFIELEDKVDRINKKAEAERGLIEGAIYYQINVPSKAENFTATPNADKGRVDFVFNDVTENPGEVQPATEGTYSVSLYYVNSKNKLVKLGNSVPSITVTNSTPAVKAEGFKATNVYDGNLGEADVETLLKTMYNFSWNGELMYDEDRYWNVESDNFEIESVVYEYGYVKDDEGNIIGVDRLVVKEIKFKLGYFNDCIKNEETGRVDDNADGNYQYYTLKKRITIKAD